MNRNDIDIFFQKLNEKCDELTNFEDKIAAKRDSLIDEISNDFENTVSDLNDKLDLYIKNNFESIKESIHKVESLLRNNENNVAADVSKYNSDLSFDELKRLLKEKVTEYNNKIEKLNLIDFNLQSKERKIIQQNPYEFDVVCNNEITHYTPSSKPEKFSKEQVLKLAGENDASAVLKSIQEIETICDRLAKKYRDDFDVDHFEKTANEKKDKLIAQIDTEIKEKINNKLSEELETGELALECENLFKQLDETRIRYTPTIYSDQKSFNEKIAVGNSGYDIENYFDNEKYLERIKALQERTKNGSIGLPFIVDLKEKGNFWIDTEESNYSETTKEFVNHLILSLVLSFPTKNVHLYLLDVNEKIGFAPYLAFKKISESVLPYGVIREEERLDEILSEIKKVKYDSEDRLGMEGMTNIFDYNSKFTSSPIDINILVIADFPFGFDKAKLSKLKSILSNGKDDGVFAIIINNSSLQAGDSIAQDDEAQNIIDEIKQSSYCFDTDFGVSLTDGFESNSIEISNPIKVSDIGRIVEAKIADL